MVKLLGLSVILMTFVGCSTNSKKNDLVDALARPSWVNSAAGHCEKKGFLCASSEANSSFKADLQAKNNLAATFETYIESEVSTHKSLKSTNHTLTDFDIQEQVNKDVREKVSVLLSGVMILERAHKNGVYYSLAAIDRLKTSRSLKKEIEKHDERLLYLWGLQNKTKHKKMMEHYYQREAYNKKLSVLSFGVKSPVTLSQLDQLRDKSIGAGGKLLLELNSLDDHLADSFRGYMAGLGYQLVLDSSKYDYKIVGDMKKSNEFFKVKGFAKLGFSVSLRSFNAAGVEVGGFHVRRSGIGRNQDDAFKQIEPELQKYIENHLDELRLGE